MLTIEKATLTPLTDHDGNEVVGPSFDVDFNPENLTLTLANNLDDNAGDNPAQHVSDTTGTLGLSLIFDGTVDATDVREKTQVIARYLNPSLDVAHDRQPRLNKPLLVAFEWGSFIFVGYIQAYEETIDFFSAEGVPLRATVALTLIQQDYRHEDRSRDAAERARGALGPRGEGFAGAASSDAAEAEAEGEGEGEDPGADDAPTPEDEDEAAPGKDLKPKDGPSGWSDIQAAAAAGFAAGAGFGIGASAGIGVSAGIGLSAGVGASAGIGLSAGASAGLSAGASASASAGFAAGASASASAGFSASASASTGFGASASAAAGFGASASAGFGASASAAVGFSAGASASAGFGASASASSAAGFSAQASARSQFLADVEATVGVGDDLLALTGAGASYAAFAELGKPVPQRDRRPTAVTLDLGHALRTDAGIELGGRSRIRAGIRFGGTS